MDASRARTSAGDVALLTEPLAEHGISVTAGATARGKAGLTRRDFFADVVERLRVALPDDLSSFQTKMTMNLLKIYYGNERVHYEVWTNGQQRTIELGLHFEDGALSTAAYLAHFDRYIVELKHELGPFVELERWTQSWGHVYELMPLTTLDDGLVRRTATRLSAMITILQPLVDIAEVAPERSRLATEPRGPWRKWRRGHR